MAWVAEKPDHCGVKHEIEALILTVIRNEVAKRRRGGGDGLKPLTKRVGTPRPRRVNAKRSIGRGLRTVRIVTWSWWRTTWRRSAILWRRKRWRRRNMGRGCGAEGILISTWSYCGASGIRDLAVTGRRRSRRFPRR